jgi:phospholipase/carboxylesterase
MHEGLDVSGLAFGDITWMHLPPLREARSIVVLLHGYGMDATDLAPLANAMDLNAHLILPRGPHVVPSGGYAWWPVDEQRRSAQLLDGPRDLVHEYPAGRDALRALLADACRAFRVRFGNLPLVLAGFSQGGMLACDAVLHQSVPARALVLMSSSRIAAREWQLRGEAVREIPVLISHGQQDPDLSFEAGKRLKDFLVAGGATVTWLPFEGGHSIPLVVWRRFRQLVAEITDIRQQSGEIQS